MPKQHRCSAALDLSRDGENPVGPRHEARPRPHRRSSTCCGRLPCQSSPGGLDSWTRARGRGGARGWAGPGRGDGRGRRVSAPAAARWPREGDGGCGPELWRPGRGMQRPVSVGRRRSLRPGLGLGARAGNLRVAVWDVRGPRGHERGGAAGLRRSVLAEGASRASGAGGRCGRGRGCRGAPWLCGLLRASGSRVSPTARAVAALSLCGLLYPVPDFLPRPSSVSLSGISLGSLVKFSKISVRHSEAEVK